MRRKRLWWRIDPPLLEVADTPVVAASIFDWLGETLTPMTIDAYTDLPPDDVPPKVAHAEALLRALRPGREEGDAWTVSVTPEQPEAWAAAQICAPWSILCTLITKNGPVGSFDDCGCVSLKLSPEQAASLGESLGDQAALSPSK